MASASTSASRPGDSSSLQQAGRLAAAGMERQAPAADPTQTAAFDTESSPSYASTFRAALHGRPVGADGASVASTASVDPYASVAAGSVREDGDGGFPVEEDDDDAAPPVHRPGRRDVVCCVCHRAIVAGQYSTSPNGETRHAGCSLTCLQCGVPTKRPVFRTGVKGAYCSSECLDRSDPRSLRCCVCEDVIAPGTRYSVLPDGRNRHMGCALSCDFCGSPTTQPTFFKHVKGTFCSPACAYEADPKALRCHVCSRALGADEHAVAPSGVRRHFGCAVPCARCGRATKSPVYLRSRPGDAFCSDACSSKNDPSVCHKRITGDFYKDTRTGRVRHTFCRRK